MERDERLSRALRENLRRRKAQARARAEAAAAATRGATPDTVDVGAVGGLSVGAVSSKSSRHDGKTTD